MDTCKVRDRSKPKRNHSEDSPMIMASVSSVSQPNHFSLKGDVLMPKKQTDRKVYEEFILSLLSKHLDNTIASVKVAVEPPFILIYLSDFLCPRKKTF
ncbi:hypothetical protein D9754_16390 [Planomicrobium sp. Y74]|nr:hypothetical protein D9754_16390 [Planomicrobium sp. Y74]